MDITLLCLVFMLFTHWIADFVIQDDDIVKGIVRGHVHDELSYILGEVSGHAGLFSTASDIQHFIEKCRLSYIFLIFNDCTINIIKL